MDFIIKFPKSEDLVINIKYDNILVIVNKLIKYTYLILYNEKFTAKQITQIVLDRVIQYYRISEIIISDRDRIFINNF